MGSKLLMKAGGSAFQIGEGMGKHGTGILNPVQIKSVQKGGVGADRGGAQINPKSLLEEAERAAQKQPGEDIDMDVFDKAGEEQRREENQRHKEKLDEEDKAFLALFGNRKRHQGPRKVREPREPRENLKKEIDRMEERLELRQQINTERKDPYEKLNIIDMRGQEEQQIFVSRR